MQAFVNERTIPKRGQAFDAPALEQLADRIAQAVGDSPRWPKGSLARVWYLLNIENPVVDKLLDRYRLSIGAPRGMPLSDRERLLFELQLLRPSVMEMIAAAVTQVEADNAYEKGEKENG